MLKFSFGVNIFSIYFFKRKFLKYFNLRLFFGVSKKNMIRGQFDNCVKFINSRTIFVNAALIVKQETDEKIYTNYQLSSYLVCL